MLGGIGKGIERACKVMMPLLFLIMLVLIARAVTLPGALQGLDFYLRPDFSKLTWPALLDALSQGFFSLSQENLENRNDRHERKDVQYGGQYVEQDVQ